MIIQSFKKYGTTNAVIMPEDNQVNIQQIEYVMPEPLENFHLETLSEENQGDDRSKHTVYNKKHL